jgi:subtilisin family serine protease
MEVVMKKKWLVLCAAMMVFMMLMPKFCYAAEAVESVEIPEITTAGQKYSGQLQNRDQQNWYTLIPEETGSYRITLHGSDSVKSILYDGTRAKVIMEDCFFADTHSRELAHTLIKGKTYYIEIRENVDHGGNVATDAQKPYELDVSLLPKPNDTYFSEQWGLFNSRNGLDIDILPAWTHGRGNDMKIGIADSGADYNHPELVRSIDLSLSYNFTHDSRNVFPLTEYFTDSSARAGHGTHVAGIIGAEADNNEGIAGIAPGMKLVMLKVLGSRLSDSTVYTGSIAAFVKAVGYARSNGIKIMNCSFGGVIPSVSEKEAMQTAKDMLFVIAGGNVGNDLARAPEYPACYYLDNSLVVAAVNQQGELAEFSNYGGPTEIAAPGEEIFSTYPGNGYEIFGGTSMAAPVVSAIAGLVLENNRAFGPAEVKNRIADQSNVTVLDSLAGKVISNGMVNAYKAVSSGNTVGTRHVQNIGHKVFERSIKSEINEYKEEAGEEIKTNQVIVKLEEDVNSGEWIDKIGKESIFQKMEQIDYLPMIHSYVYQFLDIVEANAAVSILNTDSDVVYAEMNYLRK